MFESILFLGFKVEQHYSIELAALNPDLLKLYTHSPSDYLEEIVQDNQRFLGKFLDNPCDLNTLELTKLHIYSVLKKLVPAHSYDKSELWLIPLIKPAKQPK